MMKPIALLRHPCNQFLRTRCCRYLNYHHCGQLSSSCGMRCHEQLWLFLIGVQQQWVVTKPLVHALCFGNGVICETKNREFVTIHQFQSVSPKPNGRLNQLDSRHWFGYWNVEVHAMKAEIVVNVFPLVLQLKVLVVERFSRTCAEIL